jgi:hypothetical protein
MNLIVRFVKSTMMIMKSYLSLCEFEINVSQYIYEMIVFQFL